mgnify:CR=1 FL=1
MIEIGKYNTLTILRDTKVGLFLGNPQEDPEGINDILLPNKYVPNKFEIGDELTVFVYLDHEERPVSTTLEPYILLNEFALLGKENISETIGDYKLEIFDFSNGVYITDDKGKYTMIPKKKAIKLAQEMLSNTFLLIRN